MRNIVNMMSPRLLRFSMLEFFFWSMCAAYYPFTVVYLSSKGYSNTIIGTIMAINSLVLVFAQPIWGMVSDRMQSIKKVFILLITISTCMLLVLPLAQSLIITGIMLAVLTFFESSMPPLLDSWVIQGIRTEPNAFYGGIRLWGSVGFAIMVFVFGRLADILSVNIIFPSYAIFAVLTILMCLQIKTDKPVAAVSLANLKIGSLVKNYHYIVFLIFATILYTPHRSAFIFLPRLIETLGGTETDLGISISIMALSEAVIYLTSKYLTKKFKPIQLILMSTVFFVLRQILFFIASAPIHVLFIQTLQGPSFALFMTGTVYYIDSLAPEKLKSFAQTFGSAIFAGIGGIVGSYGGGWIIDYFGINRLYQVGIFMSSAVSTIFILSLSIGKLSNKADTKSCKHC